MADSDTRQAEELQRDIAARRRDLTRATGELRDIARDTLDFRRQATHIARLGTQKTGAALVRAGNAARERPFVTGLLVVGALGAFVLTRLARQRHAQPNWKLQLRLVPAVLAQAFWLLSDEESRARVLRARE